MPINLITTTIMIKKYIKKVMQQKPIAFVAIGYDNVYDDFTNVNPLKILEGIPTIAILKYVVEDYSSIFYAQSNESAQRNLIYKFCTYLPIKTRQRIWKFIRNTEADGHHVFLYEAIGCRMLYRLALQTYTPLNENDDIELCENEYEPLFKAILYCNKLWTDQQLLQKQCPLSEILLKIDIPIVENKQYKDYRTQLYKAYRFFSFCEKDVLFRTYLPYFIQDKNVENWGEYIMLLFNGYFYSIKDCIIPHGNNSENKFLSQFLIDTDDTTLATLWDIGNKGFEYFYNHFLYMMPNGDFLLLDANLLIDKLYQGLKFDLFQTIQKHCLLNKKGKHYKDISEFNSTLGTIFSERHLLYELIDKIYNKSNIIKFTGEELKAAGIEGEPDYYLRIEDDLFLIEYKDLIFPDSLRYSDNIDDIKQGIINRLCLDDGIKRKGGGQLLFNIDRILNHNLMDNIDIRWKSVKRIFPLIVTTDRAFSAMGVNFCVIESFDQIMKRKYSFKQPVLIFKPVILNIDSLIILSYRLNKSILQLSDVLYDYIMLNWKNISSFDNYVYDKYKESKTDLTGSIHFLLEDLVKRIAKLTNSMFQ